MKKIYVFLCMAFVLFLGSCTADLSMDDEEAVRADLPADFKWQDYARINNDVKVYQIILDVIEKNKEYSESDVRSNCVSILTDDSFARDIYENYMQCPVQAWDPNKKCTGKFAYNVKYTTDTTCVIEGCWSGGWGELLAGWQDSLANYSGVVKTMCQFIPPSGDAKEYLENFVYDPYLIEQHYHFFGRSDGRPYKNCTTETCEEKDRKFAILRNNYYDYSRYTFCLNDDEKICVVQ